MLTLPSARSGSHTPVGISRAGTFNAQEVSLEDLSAWLTELEAGERRMRASLEAQHSYGNLDAISARREGEQRAKPAAYWVEPWNADSLSLAEKDSQQARRRRHRKLKRLEEEAKQPAQNRKSARCFSPSSIGSPGLARLLGRLAK